MKRRIIIADGDKQNEKLIKNILSREGYDVTAADNFGDCYTEASLSAPDLVIIDPLYPSTEGLRLISDISRRESCAVISVSSVWSERTVTEILDAGADDCIKKPFFTGELKARVRAAVRRLEKLEAARGADGGGFYKHGSLTVDYDSHTVRAGEMPIHLTKNEFRILTLLCRYSGRVLTYDFIQKSIWGPETAGNNGILRVNITNLRKKIEPEPSNPIYLFTENGVGYRIAENTSESI